ncbi:hypothetical protein BD408DRAFT_407265 [Parasitella parasitica]|nr:hypothetical protein BD408DRAFT_407265 [Parasitella parasitica]
MISPGYIEKSQKPMPSVFKAFYRINLETFGRIVIIGKASKGLLPDISVELQVACIFWRFTNTHFGSLILTRTGLSAITYRQIHKAFIKVLRNQSGKMMNWPYKDFRRAQEISGGFKRSGGLNGVIGVVNCKRAAIRYRQIIADTVNKDAVMFINAFAVFDHIGKFNYLQANNAGL